MERKHEKYERLIARCKAMAPIPTAVAHPCDESSLRGAVEAAEMGILQPILVGPRDKIKAVAAQFHLDISKYEIVDAEHSNDSAAKAVQLAREGKAEMLMKGSLHTDELMGAVVRSATGLRTERRISHAFIMDVPSLDRTIIVTDAAINIFPTLEDKKHIVQNAIDLLTALGFPQPKVAILSAMETVNPDVPSTVEAAALCKMADRKQITGGILDGPLALDATSTQGWLAATLTQSVAAGKTISIVSGDTVIASYTTLRTVSSVVFTSSAIQKGQTYDIYVGGSLAGEASGTYSAGGSISGASKLSTVTAGVATRGGGMGRP